MQAADHAAAAGISAACLRLDNGLPVVGWDEHVQYRSASLVKLLIALDRLESRSTAALPAEEDAMLRSMLRSSDDDAASELWVRGGQDDLVVRIAERIGLDDTEPPADPGMWGYTAISAADVGAVYQYILSAARPEVRTRILLDLRHWTRHASDGCDQSFGIPRAVAGPCAVKQGWSGFDRSGSLATRVTSAQRLDLTRRAMHTSGVVGASTILIVLTLHPPDTPWDICAERVTALARALARRRD